MLVQRFVVLAVFFRFLFWPFPLCFHFNLLVFFLLIVKKISFFMKRIQEKRLRGRLSKMSKRRIKLEG